VNLIVGQLESGMTMRQVPRLVILVLALGAVGESAASKPTRPQNRPLSSDDTRRVGWLTPVPRLASRARVRITYFTALQAACGNLSSDERELIRKSGKRDEALKVELARRLEAAFPEWTIVDKESPLDVWVMVMAERSLYGFTSEQQRIRCCIFVRDSTAPNGWHRYGQRVTQDDSAIYLVSLVDVLNANRADRPALPN
jgi:hypothetical protein